VSRKGPLERLSAVEWSLEAAPESRPGDTFHRSERWLQAVSDRLGATGVVEAGLVAAIRARIRLTMSGPLSREKDGGVRAYGERAAEARVLRNEVVSWLTSARARLARRVKSSERLAESAVRAGAEARLLAAPDRRPRAEWLGDMALRMASHPTSAPDVARLALGLPGPEVLMIFDRVFRVVFEV
jgi:hypothetical protein